MHTLASIEIARAVQADRVERIGRSIGRASFVGRASRPRIRVWFRR